MKLLIDMNMSPRWVSFLNGVGIDAVHWSSIGSQKAADVDIMTYAATLDLIVLTHDLDFGAILAATQGDKPSVVQIRADDLRPAQIGPQVVRALFQSASELANGALVTVDPQRTRLRILPLKVNR